MVTETSRNHHYVPRFYLRNFSNDGIHVPCVGKSGGYAVWRNRAIENLGSDTDFYIHAHNGSPVCVEELINRSVENPISNSETWRKIKSGATGDLDRSDKFVIYALMRHFEVRTPHYRRTIEELAALAVSDKEEVEFDEDEREYFKYLYHHPDELIRETNAMAASVQWTERNFAMAALTIIRSPVELRSSTTPSQPIAVAPDPRIYLPLRGMKPYQIKLTLNRFTAATLILADFDDAFMNVEVEEDVARGLNRHAVAHFSHFPSVRHLITSTEGLDADMAWAHFDKTDQSETKFVYKKQK